MTARHSGRRAGRSKRRRKAGFLRRLRIPRGMRRAFVQAPGFVQGCGIIAVLLMLWFALNGLYQVIRKPSELFFPVSGTLNKTPAETWRDYGPLFHRFSTDLVTAELLAALAQVEASGNPVARTYWRWSLTARPFDVYRPASSSVGMYQMTDGTFAAARSSRTVPGTTGVPVGSMVSIRGSSHRTRSSSRPPTWIEVWPRYLRFTRHEPQRSSANRSLPR
jgi:hypothetical protein